MNRVLLGLGVTFVAVAIVAVQLFRALGPERDRNRELLARIEALESRPGATTMPTGSPAAIGTGAAIAAASGAAAAGATTAAAPGAARGTGEQDMMAAFAQAMDTPEMRELAYTFARANMTEQYPDLAKELGLSAEEAEKFLDYLAKYQVDQGLDMANQGLAQRGNRAAQEELGRQFEERERQHEAEIATRLGAAYPKWQEYERTAATRQQQTMQRRQAAELRAAVSSSSDPLTDAQFEAFSTALTAERRKLDQDPRGQDTPQQAAGMLAERQKRLLDVAAVHLNPAQLERYRRQLKQETDMMQLSLGMMEGMMGQQEEPPRPAQPARP